MKPVVSGRVRYAIPPGTVSPILSIPSGPGHEARSSVFGSVMLPISFVFPTPVRKLRFSLDHSTKMMYNTSCSCAGITQLVEYLTRNEEVEGSSPFSSSLKWAANGLNDRVLFVAHQAGGLYRVRTSLP